jgi:hypothetical protein
MPSLFVFFPVWLVEEIVDVVWGSGKGLGSLEPSALLEVLWGRLRHCSCV